MQLRQLRLWITKSLSADEADSVAVHIRQCGCCQEHLTELAGTTESATPLAEEHSIATHVDGARIAIREMLAMPIQRLGKYDIVRPLGGGGFGLVYHAKNAETGRDFALKILKRETDSRDALRTLIDEAKRSCSMKNHPNILHAFSVEFDQDTPFLVMELVEGGSLRQRLGESPAFVNSSMGIATIVHQAALGLTALHEHGLLHLDIKPENILWDSSSKQNKLSDFGMDCRIVEARGQELRYAIGGSPPYMSPEQISSQPVDERSDVYSLGAVLYELLTERQPFIGGETQIRHDIQNTTPVHPCHVNKLASPDLATIALKCLEKDPDRRYASAKDLADDLHRFLNSYPILARPAPAWRTTSLWIKRNPTMALFSGASSLVAMGLLVFSIVVATKNREITAKNAELATANLEVASALHDTRQVISDGMTILIRHDNLASEPMQEELYRSYVPYFETIRDTSRNDPARLGEAAESNFRLAFAEHFFHHPESAARYLETASRLFEQLHARRPLTDRECELLFGFMTDVGTLEKKLGKEPSNRLQSLHEGLRIATEFDARLHSERSEEMVAISHLNLGAQYNDLGERELSKSHLETARQSLESLRARYHKATVSDYLAVCHFNLARLAKDEASSEALAHFEQADLYWQQMGATSDYRFLRNRVDALVESAELADGQGRQEILAKLQMAIGIAMDWCAANPMADDIARDTLLNATMCLWGKTQCEPGVTSSKVNQGQNSVAHVNHLMASPRRSDHQLVATATRILIGQLEGLRLSRGLSECQSETLRTAYSLAYSSAPKRSLQRANTLRDLMQQYPEFNDLPHQVFLAIDFAEAGDHKNATRSISLIVNDLWALSQSTDSNDRKQAGEQMFNAACAYSQIGRAVSFDPDLTPDQRDAEMAHVADKSIQFLRADTTKTFLQQQSRESVRLQFFGDGSTPMEWAHLYWLWKCRNEEVISVLCECGIDLDRP